MKNMVKYLLAMFFSVCFAAAGIGLSDGCRAAEAEEAHPSVKRISNAADVRGRITDGGDPVNVAEIAFHGRTASGEPFADYVMGENDGRYEFHNLPYGKYRISVKIYGVEIKTSPEVTVDRPDFAYNFDIKDSYKDVQVMLRDKNGDKMTHVPVALEYTFNGVKKPDIYNFVDDSGQFLLKLPYGNYQMKLKRIADERNKIIEDKLLIVNYSTNAVTFTSDK